MILPAKFVSRFSTALFITALLATAHTAHAQKSRKEEKVEKKAERREKVNQMIKAEEEGAIIYSKQWMLGGKLLTDGWSAFYEQGKMKSVTKTNWWTIEFGERKHPKEERIAKDDGSGFFLGTPLVYGKQNTFLYTKVGFGQQFLIGGKGNRNGVAVSAVYGGGLSIGLLKPYYVDVVDPITNQTLSVKYKGDGSRTDSLFLDPNYILGGSGFFKGFDEIQIKPGLYTKTGFRFDYGRYNEIISAIECGINAEFYFSDMPMMVDNEAKKLFLGFYVAIDFGRRR
jgi:hypothetical protein